MENLTEMKEMIASTINIIAFKSKNVYDFIFSLNHIKGYNVYQIKDEMNTLTIQVFLGDKCIFNQQNQITEIEQLIEGLK